MNKARKKTIRLNVAKKLRLFGTALYDNKIINDKKKFDTAAKKSIKSLPVIKGVQLNYANHWGYEISDLPLNFTENEIKDKIVNTDARISSIVLSSKVIGKFLDNDLAEDPLAYLEFNLVVKGKDKNGKDLVNSWHLDRHPDNSHSESAHPTYHFQYGGKKLMLPNNENGNHLVIDTPRIMHPPLDIILGVDFVLSNFLGKKRAFLCEKVRPYLLSVESLQKMVWRPYIYSVARHWSSYPNNNANYKWKCEEIAPQLLKSN